jgi:hypothetical protein
MLGEEQAMNSPVQRHCKILNAESTLADFKKGELSLMNRHTNDTAFHISSYLLSWLLASA